MFARFAGIGVGAYLAYKPPVPETAKSVVIGRVLENAVETAIFKVARYEGTWARTGLVGTHGVSRHCALLPGGERSVTAQRWSHFLWRP